MDIKLEKKTGWRAILQKKNIPYAVAAIFMILVVALLLRDNSSTLRVDANILTISPVEQTEFNDYVRLAGTVKPITTVQISPMESGLVERIVAEEGTMVRKGDVIVELSNNSLSMQILNSEADLAEKQNILRNTLISMEQNRLNLRQEQMQLDMEVERKRRAFTNNDVLYKKELLARETWLQSKEDYEYSVKRRSLIMERQKQDSLYRTNQVKQMESDLQSMARNMQLIRQRVDNLLVKAPIDGEVGALDVVLGRNVGSGSSIGQINDMSAFKVATLIDEHYIDRIVVGLPATIERQERKYDMVIRKVYPEVSGGQFRADFTFAGDIPENIRIGQTYHINLQLGEASEAVIIPRGAFYQTTGGSWIYVVDPSGEKAYRRDIRIGRQNPQHYEVLEGLEPGEKVITSAYENFGSHDVLILKR
ncbi:MAG: HlyD family efflux transporter periplasmic adaptor subunit [Alistipes sp.]|nr:HlyD family efflux transporter periplasmic adaptor subunit [Alistipes sp.]MBQ3196954.1 HlyD family efflux transporter periplasmic adaptor subunit [Alistipes sp.]MBQ4532320.1 HlyD family efflux transporter periplasmic adaptor subunit [Alistipes sp.]MBQ6988644.1 HlyD family efflux transporter periplasmic adaptor subunit [Alistipes sp.]